MADVVFNVAKGRIMELHDRVDGNDPANSGIVVVLLKVAAADAVLIDQATLAAVLAGGSTECDFGGYSRQVLTDAATGPTVVDNTNNRREAPLPTQSWTPSAPSNNVVKALICYDPDTTGGTDSAIVPLTAHDWVLTTGTAPISLTAASGYARAS